ncbi:MAG: hypothetical protein M1820_004936 [Bogoriella megaspora]|nr:MAG: hypothetical protein M1820_004936 [Bogoriella megaspora]
MAPNKVKCSDLQSLLPVESTSPPYWAQQQSTLQSACYVRPTDSRAVSQALLTAKKHSCSFAIRGAGHSDVPGASNAPGGLTIDLGALQEITVTAENTVTRVGAGNTWGDVYSSLDLLNLTVVGGREKSVGVAGLTLGGGVSYFSGLYGFACDNVINYEVILADGTIAQVNSSSEYAELYRALRGGGNNFGIVTRFDLDTYPYDLMYGGLTAWVSSPNTTSALISAYTIVTAAAPSDPNGAMFLAQGYYNGTFIWSAGLEYAKPDTNPALFAPFNTPSLQATRILTTERISNHSGLTVELDATQPPGFRNQFATATYISNPTLMHRMSSIYESEVKSALSAGLSADPAFGPTLAFQPLTSNILQHTTKRGGNVLGLSASEAPLMLMNFGWQWSNASLDSVVKEGIANIVEKSNQAAAEMGLLNDYVYMNYAAPGQDPVKGYGQENVEFMKEVQRKWDPEGVFTKLCPGGFKVT